MSELVVTYSLPCDAMQNHQHPPLAVLSYAYDLRQQVVPVGLPKVGNVYCIRSRAVTTLLGDRC